MANYESNRTYNFIIEGEAELAQVQKELERTNELLNQTQDELDETKQKFESLQQKYDFETSTSGVAAMRDNLESLQEATSRTAREFEAMVRSFNVNPDAMTKSGFTLDDYTERIREGWTTFSQAATSFKTQYAELIQDVYSVSGGSIDTQMFSSLIATVDGVVKSLEELHTKVNEISASGGGGSGGGVVDMTNAIEQLKDAATGLPEELKGSYEAITGLVTALTDLGNVDDNKIVTIKRTFESIAAIGSGNYGTKSIAGLTSMLKELEGKGGIFNLRVDLQGLSGLKVNQDAYAALALYLPVIASVDAEKLSLVGIAASDLLTFNELKIKPSVLKGITELSNALQILADNPIIQQGVFQNVEDVMSSAATPTKDSLVQTAKRMHDLLNNLQILGQTGTPEFQKLTASCEKFDKAIERLGAGGTSVKKVLQEVFGKTNMSIINDVNKTIHDLQYNTSKDSSKALTSATKLATQMQATLDKNSMLKGTQSYSAMEDALRKLQAALAECDGDADKLGTALFHAFGEGANAIEACKLVLAKFGNDAENVQAATKAIDEYYKAANAAAKNPDIMRTDAGTWTTTNSALNEQVQHLNDLKAAMDAFIQSGEGARLTEEQLNAVLQYRNLLEEHLTNTLSAKKDAVKNETNALNSYNSALKQSEQDLKQFAYAQTSSNEASKKAFADMKVAAQEMSAAYAAWKVNPSVENVQRLEKATNNYFEKAAHGKAVITALDGAHKTFGATLSGFASKFAYMFSATRIMMAIYRTMKQMVQGAIELDSAMTQLQIVTGETDAQMNQFANTLATAAQRAAVPIKDLIESATTFARLGYSSGESAQLAEFTAMLQNVGNIDTSKAQDAVTSIIKAYGVSVDQIESVMDKLVSVGKMFAQGCGNAA